MAVVKALCIRGIRSFGPDDGDQQQVSFSRPLTLILGANGCGKTTIIESLRYAVTGQQPPGARNECFVYDARVNRTRDVLGQTKLKIVNAKGNELTVIRSMQVTSKEKRTQFKTLDASIERIDEKGKKVEISSRCGDIDFLMQEELGVSKAIINSVIFCHQEDSCWPLDEGKKVKDRFDEIFDADKYSNCFDRLKKIRKEYAITIKLLEQEVTHLAERKTELDKKKLAVVNTEARVSEAELKMVAFDRDIKPVEDKLKAIEAIQHDLVAFELKKGKNKDRLEHCLTRQEELKKAINNIFKGSDEELKINIDNYESMASSKQKDLDDLRNRLNNLGQQEQQTARSISSNEVEFNKLMLLEGQHQDRVHQRNTMLGDAADLAGVKISEEIESQEEASAAMNTLTHKLSTTRSELAVMTRDADAEEKRLQQIVDERRDALSRHKQKILNKESKIQEMNREISRLEQEISDANESKQRLDSLQTQLETVEREYEGKRSELDCDACQSEINEDEKELEKMDAQLDVLNDKITKLQKQSAKLAEKQLKQQSLASAQKSLQVAKNKHRSGLMELLQRMPEQQFAVAVSEAQCVLKAEVDGARQRLKDKNMEVAKLESERGHVREQLKRARAELSNGEDSLYQACGSGTYKATLDKLNDSLELLRKEQNVLQSSVFIISKYKEQLQENNNCPLCHRGFESQSEVMELLSELTTRVFNVPDKLKSVTFELDKAAMKRDQLVSLRSLSDKIQLLKDKEIPEVKSRLENIDKELSVSQERVEEWSMSLAEPEQRLRTAQQLAVEMPLLDKYVQEISKIQKDLEVLDAQCLASADGLTLENASTQQSELRQKISALRAKIKTKQSELNEHTRALQSIMQRKNQMKEQLLNIQKKVQEVCSLQDSLTQYTSNLEKARTELSAQQQETSLLETELKKKECSKTTMVTNTRANLDKRRVFLRELEGALEKINACEKQIKQHEANNAEEKLRALKETGATLQGKKTKLSEEKEETSVKIDLLKDELSKQEMYKRDLEDNWKLRCVEQEVAECRRDKEQIDKGIGGINTEMLSDADDLIRRRRKLLDERASTEGQINLLKETLKNSKLELMRSHNKDLEQQYRLKLYEVQVVKSLDKDIKDYSAAMDKCLMQFHKEKMENINLIIREMWRKIYRGNDIDYIEIKTGNTDNEKDRRKYEYRVVQSKNGVEIDMRGRCSAGQKVLACLIIRLALAETFSTRLGVLALDEPTTNLDSENVRSLCGALGDIVAERRRQNNFMFIIITHDREFIESLGNIDKVSHFYEVSRNDDGKSRIKRVKFT